MARVRELTAWWDGEPVARLRAPRVGRVTCEYTRAALDPVPLGTPLLSCSLPARPGAHDAWAFVTGLLPEGQHRLAMAQQAGVPTTDRLGILARFGRDVAGALGIAAGDPSVRRAGDDTSPSLESLDADDLAAEVGRLPEHPLGLHDDSELSIAGLQDKLLLVRTPEGWARPRHGYPSTHILKVDDRLRRGLVRAEHACLQLARAAGVPAAASELITVGDADCIVVERFDRCVDGASVRRIHQEDACQALGVDPEAHDRRAKYEQYGGPTFRQVAGLLEAWGADPEWELRRLLERVVFTVVVGDADAHGKNLSLLHPAPGMVELAPLYDIVPTALWPTLRPLAAMRIAGRELLTDVTAPDLASEARQWGLSRAASTTVIRQVIDRLEAAVDAGAVDDVPGLAPLVRANLARLGE
jgi:serine/threonine-protein kinase HipA